MGTCTSHLLWWLPKLRVIRTPFSREEETGVTIWYQSGVPSRVRDGDLWDSDFSGFQCLLGIGYFKIKVTPFCPESFV
ncbi:hypothetical protein YC2023_083025 [Brassica napus]